jgi:hypothetical protein
MLTSEFAVQTNQAGAGGIGTVHVIPIPSQPSQAANPESSAQADPSRIAGFASESARRGGSAGGDDAYETPWFALRVWHELQNHHPNFNRENDKKWKLTPFGWGLTYMAICGGLAWIVSLSLAGAVLRSSQGSLSLEKLTTTISCSCYSPGPSDHNSCSCTLPQLAFVAQDGKVMPCSRIVDSMAAPTYLFTGTVPGSYQLDTAECWFQAPNLVTVLVAPVIVMVGAFIVGFIGHYICRFPPRGRVLCPPPPGQH